VIQATVLKIYSYIAIIYEQMLTIAILYAITLNSVNFTAPTDYMFHYLYMYIAT